MIVITFALPNESSGFVRLIANGRLHGHEVRVLHTGVGEHAVRACLAKLFQDNSPRLLISSGFAGGLTDEVKVGDLLLAENFSDTQLLEPARHLGTVGRLQTTSAIADSSETRADLARSSGASAVDMETAVIADACAERQIPMLSLRAISDTPDAPFSIPARVLFNLEKQRTDFGVLFRHLVRHPGDIVRLIAIARQAKKARRALTSALDQLFRVLPKS
ncbi:MAG: 5'-methylthioadenosine/S-adenosylhomocysteine nucleosidase family protein [Chthoniobacterales bacterium]